MLRMVLYLSEADSDVFQSGLSMMAQCLSEVSCLCTPGLGPRKVE